MTQVWTGGCQCSEVRYELSPDGIDTMYACHCTDCQRQSASAFGISIIVKRDAFRLVKGAVKTWMTQGESGNAKCANFCPTCGTRVFHDDGGDSAWISVKGGTLDDPAHLKPKAHLWVKRQQLWLKLDDNLIRHSEEPPN